MILAGQGGHGTYTDLWLPKRLLLARPVEKIAFGYDHCLAITQGIPELYAWGRGGQGQLGIGRAKGSAEPVLVRQNNSCVENGNNFSHLLI